MAELSPALAAALRGERPLLFGAVEIALPDYTIRLLDGAGEVMIGAGAAARKFSGRDPVYGVLDSIKGLSSAIGDQAPTVTLGLIPSATAALARLLDPAVQGSAVTIMVGVLDIGTGRPVADPYVVFSGELDVPTVKWGANDRRLEYRATSIAERLFQVEEGKRLSDTFHQHIWPGELGLAFVTGVEANVPWGQKVDNSAVTIRTNDPSIGPSTWQKT